jgi:hypothetical protein
MVPGGWRGFVESGRRFRQSATLGLLTSTPVGLVGFTFSADLRGSTRFPIVDRELLEPAITILRCGLPRGELLNRWASGDSPPWPRRGGRDINKNAAKPPLRERTGWLVQLPIIRWFEPTTPSAPANEASRHLISGAAPLLGQGGECLASTVRQHIQSGMLTP